MEEKLSINPPLHYWLCAQFHAQVHLLRCHKAHKTASTYPTPREAVMLKQSPKHNLRIPWRLSSPEWKPEHSIVARTPETSGFPNLANSCNKATAFTEPRSFESYSFFTQRGKLRYDISIQHKSRNLKIFFILHADIVKCPPLSISHNVSSWLSSKF